jgi:hypothetical protein
MHLPYFIIDFVLSFINPSAILYHMTRANFTIVNIISWVHKRSQATVIFIQENVLLFLGENMKTSNNHLPFVGSWGFARITNQVPSFILCLKKVRCVRTFHDGD